MRQTADAWILSQHSLYLFVQLLHDMGNCETLLIDGESLCLDAFSAGCPSPLQPLSLVAHAEKLLQQLLQSRA
eukprot:scaffold328113_cov70-Tisochrysis_lutea.AAC.1